MPCKWTISWKLTNATNYVDEYGAEVDPGVAIVNNSEYFDRLEGAQGSSPCRMKGWTFTLPDLSCRVGAKESGLVQWPYSATEDGTDSTTASDPVQLLDVVGVLKGYAQYKGEGRDSANNLTVHWEMRLAADRSSIPVVVRAVTQGRWRSLVSVQNAIPQIMLYSVGDDKAAIATNNTSTVRFHVPATTLRRRIVQAARAEADTWAPLVNVAKRLAGENKTWAPDTRDAVVKANVAARDERITTYFSVLQTEPEVKERTAFQLSHRGPEIDSRHWCGIFAFWCIRHAYAAQRWTMYGGLPVGRPKCSMPIDLVKKDNYRLLRPGDILYYDAGPPPGGKDNHFVVVTENLGGGSVEIVQGNGTDPYLSGGVRTTFTCLIKLRPYNPGYSGTRPLVTAYCGAPAPACLSEARCLLSATRGCPSGYGPEEVNGSSVTTTLSQ